MITQLMFVEMCVRMCVRVCASDDVVMFAFFHDLFARVDPAEAASTETQAALGNCWLFEEWSRSDLFQSDCFDLAAPLQPVTDQPSAQSDREREISLAEWRHSNSAICIMNFKPLNPRPALFLRFVPLSFSGVFSSFLAAAACSQLIAGRHSGRGAL